MDAGDAVTPPPIAGPLRLLPFRALTLASSRIGEPSSVRAFTLPYRGVAARLQQWEQHGQVVHDAHPAVYLHEYTAGGITIRGLVGGLDLTRRARTRAATAVFPHEGTHPDQVHDLAARMLEMEINPAPILLLHRGTETTRGLLAQVQRRQPYLEFTDRAQQQHRIWAIRDRREQSALEAAIADGPALIADGHHRCAAYQRMRAQRPGAATDAGLAMLVDQDDTPLYLGAIHRVFGATTLEQLRRATGRIGTTFEEVDPVRAIAALSPTTLVATDGARWALVRPRLAPDVAAVEWLHQDLVPALPAPPSSTGYHHSVDDALADLARSGGTAMLMPAPAFGEVMRIAAAGRLLPEKATSFQPKPSVGVLIRSLRDG